MFRLKSKKLRCALCNTLDAFLRFSFSLVEQTEQTFRCIRDCLKEKRLNKTGTSKVGAISKAESADLKYAWDVFMNKKPKGGPFGIT